MIIGVLIEEDELVVYIKYEICELVGYNYCYLNELVIKCLKIRGSWVYK